MLAQTALRGVTSLPPLSAQLRNALGQPVSPFPPNAAAMAAAAAAAAAQQQQQRLPAPIPTTVRTGTPISPTPGTSGLQAGKIAGDTSPLVPSAFTQNVLCVSGKGATACGSFSSPSPDELSSGKSGVRSRQNGKLISAQVFVNGISFLSFSSI